jgi:hypothetical protein
MAPVLGPCHFGNVAAQIDASSDLSIGGLRFLIASVDKCKVTGYSGAGEDTELHS